MDLSPLFPPRERLRYSPTGAEPGNVKTKGKELLLDTRPGQTLTFSRK